MHACLLACVAASAIPRVVEALRRPAPAALRNVLRLLLRHRRQEALLAAQNLLLLLHRARNHHYAPTQAKVRRHRHACWCLLPAAQPPPVARCPNCGCGRPRSLASNRRARRRCGPRPVARCALRRRCGSRCRCPDEQQQTGARPHRIQGYTGVTAAKNGWKSEKPTTQASAAAASCPRPRGCLTASAGAGHAASSCARCKEHAPTAGPTGEEEAGVRPPCAALAPSRSCDAAPACPATCPAACTSRVAPVRRLPRWTSTAASGVVVNFRQGRSSQEPWGKL